MQKINASRQTLRNMSYIPTCLWYSLFGFQHVPRTVTNTQLWSWVILACWKTTCSKYLMIWTDIIHIEHLINPDHPFHPFQFKLGFCHHGFHGSPKTGWGNCMWRSTFSRWFQFSSVFASDSYPDMLWYADLIHCLAMSMCPSWFWTT